MPKIKDMPKKKIIQPTGIVGASTIDFTITTKNGKYYFHKILRGTNRISRVAEGIQGRLFDLLEIKGPTYGINAEEIKENYFYVPQIKENYIQLHNRRYIGSKHKLIEWIFSIINKECSGNSFADIFAGTGVVSAVAVKHFKKVMLNDFLYSNYAIYRAFFGNGEWDKNKIDNIIKDYNNIYGEDLEDNYFSSYFGDKYFSYNSSKIIGFIRENIEKNKNKALLQSEWVNLRGF